MPDYEDIPAIEMTQWREGRVLSAADIAMIARLLKELDEEINAGVDAFHNGREQAMHEIGGEALVAMMRKGDKIDVDIAMARVHALIEQKTAKLAAVQT